MKFLDMREL